MTGTGVSVIGGQRCVTYTNGQVCLNGLSYAALSETGGLALTDTAFLLLQATPSGYTVDTAFQR